MKITSVRVHRLVSGPGFSNHAIDAEAAVGEDEDPAAALEQLTAWVEGQLAARTEIDHLYSCRDSLRYEVRSLESERDGLRKSVARGNKLIADHDKLRALAAEHGLLPDGKLLDLGDAMPF